MGGFSPLMRRDVAKQTVLLVDGDLRNLRVLEVSLRKAGYAVVACSDAEAALQTLSVSRPDVVLLDTRLPQLDGFGLVSALRKSSHGAELPCIFLSSDNSVQSQVRALELGVQDYLNKPAYIAEIVTRVALVLQRRRRAALEHPEEHDRTRFAGALEDMSLVDLMQSMDHGRKSGVLYLTRGEQRGSLYFRDGQLVHAELEHRRGERAVYRMLLWEDGNFELDAGEVRKGATIATSTQGVLMEGMRRVDEWDHLVGRLPDLDSVFEINDAELVERLAEIPDEVNAVLRHVDGQHSLMEVVDAAQGDDLETLSTLAKLYSEGLIYGTPRRATPEGGDSKPPPRRQRMQTASYEPPPPEIPAAGHYEEDTEEDPPRPSLRPSLSGNLRVRRGRRRRHEHVRTLNTIPPGKTEPGANITHSYPPNAVAALGAEESPAASRQRKRRKRLALATSPGLLSVTGMQATRVSLSPPTLAVAIRRVAEPEVLAERTVELTAPPQPLRPTTPIEAPRDAATVEPTFELTFEPDVTAPAQEPVYQHLVERPRPAMSPPPPTPAMPPLPQAQPTQDAARNASRILDPEPRLDAARDEARLQPPRPTTPLAHPEVGDETDAPWDTTAVTLAPPRRRTRMLPLAMGASVLLLGAVLLLRSSTDEGILNNIQGLGQGASHGAAVPTPPSPLAAAAPATAVDASLPERKEPDAQRNGAELQEVAPSAQATQDTADQVATPDAGQPSAPAAQLPEAAINAILLKAQQLDREGKLSQASALYEQLLESAPKRSDILGHLAFNCLNSGRNADAEQYATRAVAIDPTSSEGWIVLGAAKHTRGDVTGARQAYRQCAEQGTGAYVTECRRMLR